MPIPYLDDREYAALTRYYETSCANAGFRLQASHQWVLDGAAGAAFAAAHPVARAGVLAAGPGIRDRYEHGLLSDNPVGHSVGLAVIDRGERWRMAGWARRTLLVRRPASYPG